MINIENKRNNRRMRTDKKSKKKHRALIIIVLSVLVLLSATAVFATYYLDNILGKIDIVETPKDDEHWGIDTDASKEDDKTQSEKASVASSLSGYHNIAILGVDSYTQPGDKFTGARTDAIMIASINKKTGEVKLISVMRDSYLEVEQGDGSSIFTKVNNAYVFGGPLNTCVALNRNLDLNISQFVVFNWKSVADMVDAVGGVDLDVSKDEIDDLNLTGPITAGALGQTYTPITKIGLQHMDGVQAASYCRMRKNSGGETARTARSRETMGAIFKEARNLNLSKLTKITEEALPGIRTNITKSEMLKYILKIRSYSIAGSSRFPSQYQGGLIGDTWYAVPKNLDYNVKVLHKFLFGQRDYVLSDRAQEIGETIIQRTGYDI